MPRRNRNAHNVLLAKTDPDELALQAAELAADLGILPVPAPAGLALIGISTIRR
jgi:hypothetical protein